jgi:hypothetical protein
MLREIDLRKDVKMKKRAYLSDAMPRPLVVWRFTFTSHQQTLRHGQEKAQRRLVLAHSPMQLCIHVLVHHIHGSRNFVLLPRRQKEQCGI